MLGELKELQTIEVPGHSEFGRLSVVEFSRDLPFDVKRVYYIYGMKSGEIRGRHAHKKLCQFLICVSGSIKIALDDGKSKRDIILNNPAQGLVVPPGCWRTMEWLGDSVLLVLASENYDESDYIRNYGSFIDWVQNKHEREA